MDSEEMEEASLRPYSTEQVTKGERLPEQISLIRNDVEAGEKLKLDYTVEGISSAVKAIKERTDNRYVILGSMGLYTHLNKLRSDGTQLMLLEERISGGKNDYDVGVSEEKIRETMDQFGWDDEAKNKKRGFIGEGRQKVDILVRKELPHLPWESAEINYETFFVQSPEELIFEKMSGLIDPGVNREGEARFAEIKWGIDIKLLKTYLMMKNGWSEEQTENHLAGKWDDYLEDKGEEKISYSDASLMATKKYDSLLKNPPKEYALYGEDNKTSFEDKREKKDFHQLNKLNERLRRDKIRENLIEIKKLFGDYSETNLEDLSLEVIDGNLGRGEIIDNKKIHLQFPNQNEMILQTKGFVADRLTGKTDYEINKSAEELAYALSSTTVFHEATHGLLDSKPGSKFASDFEDITGLSNEQGVRTTLLDEGITYALMGIYSPEVKGIGSLAPVAKEDEKLEVKQRKTLGEMLRPKIKEYLDQKKVIDKDFFVFAGQSIQDLETETK